ncbi:DUF1549 domain-containing protein [Pedobacter sp. V48]|uniref:DUF1549 domain-containing protein n=1 Tax=Pedobacter sp. V48 TaxID=509635 RepID=UPI0003E49656|nr:DUF1549 domain-containing protein [Pedobacter sp. V48]ETZ20594.1 hypothetical protein N824_04395 [Pedobacter sp. V48]
MLQHIAFWLWDFLGHLHPLAVHFPVALLLFAAILELFTLKNFNSKLRSGIDALLIAGSLGAIISAALGWLLYQDGDYSGDVLTLHQWIGFTTAALGVLTLAFLYQIRKKDKLKQIKIYRGLLFSTAIGVSVAGHFGANLTHGSDFLSSTLPWSMDYETKSSDNFSLVALKGDTAKLTKKQEVELNTEVRAILAHSCYKCHGSEKVKGDLRLDGKHVAFKGGENGPVIVPGNPQESEIFKRISLPADHKDVMPSKGRKLPEKDIEIVRFWIEKGAPWPDDGTKQNVFRVAKLEPRNPVLPAPSNNLSNPVDLWTNQYFAKNKIKWPSLIDDHTYLRRIYLDIIGLLPSPIDLESFSKDARPDKRALWVKKLLGLDNDYALHWLSFWNDALRNDYSGTGYITGGRFNITDWLFKSLKTNKPYDQFVKELISPSEESKGFIEGIKWRGVVNASQRTEMQAAQNVSQVFLGLNLKCASCHNSFISDLKLDDAYAFANIFADTTLEINRCDKPTGKYVDARMLWKELGTIDNKAPVKEKRKQLAENLIKPEDGRLYRTIVNRIWSQLMGRGLVEPVDVMDNEPWSQDLLDWMAFNFVANKADLKELIYQITTSNTYQLPSVGFKEVAQVSNPNYKFKGMVRKRMSAEQFTDAVSSVINPVFADSNIRYNPQIKPSFIRASLVANNSFLTALGRPNRETVATSRDSQANLLQALELTNGWRFNSVLKNGAEHWKTNFKNTDLLIKDIYLKTLGREPVEKEIKIAKQALGKSPGVDAIQDLFWAMVLLPEFQIIY